MTTDTVAPQRLLKFLKPGGMPPHGSGGAWPLPKGKRPGAWRKVTGNLVACENGLHAVPPESLIYWLQEELYEFDYRGEIIAHTDDRGLQYVCREARLPRRIETWTLRTMRLCAIDCFMRQLPAYEAVFPNDKDLRENIATLRLVILEDRPQPDVDKIADAAWSSADAARSEERKEQSAIVLAYIEGRLP